MLATILQIVGVSVISVAAGLVYVPAGVLLAGVGVLRLTRLGGSGVCRF